MSSESVRKRLEWAEGGVELVDRGKGWEPTNCRNCIEGYDHYCPNIRPGVARTASDDPLREHVLTDLRLALDVVEAAFAFAHWQCVDNTPPRPQPPPPCGTCPACVLRNALDAFEAAP